MTWNSDFVFPAAGPVQHAHHANAPGNRLVEDQITPDHKTAKTLLDLVLTLTKRRTFGDHSDRSIQAVEEPIGSVGAILGNVKPDIT